MNPSIVQAVYDNFNQQNDNYTCKTCGKVLKITLGSTGDLTLEQRTFLILSEHIRKEQ